MCALSYAIMIFGGGQEEGASVDEFSLTLWEVVLSLLLILPLVFMLPVIAATPWVTFLLVRRTKIRALQIALLAIAAVTLVLQYRFVSTADLTSTSTAPLGAVFYQVHLAFYFVPLSLALFWLVRRKQGQAD